MALSERRRKLEEARDEIAHGRVDDAKMLIREWITEHGSDPQAKDMYRRLNDRLEDE